MASETENLNGKLEVDDSELGNLDLQENKKLRDSGLEYISRTGKTVAAKVQPEELCNCPQKCGDKIPEEVRKHLFSEFYKMADHIQQNNFLQTYIEMRSVRKRLWDDDEQRIGGRLQRRVSCKYHVPTEIPKGDTKDENNPDDKTNTDKAQSARKAATKHKVNTVEVCQKAFMNTYAITEKRIRLQREKLITKSRKDAGIPTTSTKEGNSYLWTNDLIAELGPLLMNREILANISTFENNSLPPDIPKKILHAIDNDITIVNNFFCNQLWQPEYTDCYFEKSTPLANGSSEHYLKNNSTLLTSKSYNNSTSTDVDSSLNLSTEKCKQPVTSSKKMAYGYTLPSPISTNNPVIDYSIAKNNKPLNVGFPLASTPKNINSPKPSNSGKSATSTKYLSFENSSISITPVNSKNSSNSTSSIYNNINFGNSSISITPLFRQ